MGRWPDAKRILAIDATHRGFGFVVLEVGATLLDWGTRYTAQPKDYNAIEKVDRLIDRYRPSVLVLENPTGAGSRRCLRVRQLIENLAQLGQARGLAVSQYSRGQVRMVFAGYSATTRESANIYKEGIL